MRAGSSPRATRSPPAVARAAHGRAHGLSRSSSPGDPPRVVAWRRAGRPARQGRGERAGSAARPPHAPRRGGTRARRPFPVTLATWSAPSSARRRHPGPGVGVRPARRAGRRGEPRARRGRGLRGGGGKSSSARPPRRVARDDRRSPPTPAARGCDLPAPTLAPRTRPPADASEASACSLSPGRPCLTRARHLWWLVALRGGQSSRGPGRIGKKKVRKTGTEIQVRSRAFNAREPSIKTRIQVRSRCFQRP